MNLLKRGSSPAQRHTSNSSNTSNQTAFIPGSPQSLPTQNQISPQQHHQTQTQNHHQTTSSSSNTTPPNASSATASIPLLMGGEHSAFRALNPSTAALLAASAQLGLARSYAASLAHNVASSTSTNQSPPMSPHPSESDEEINVHDDESEADVANHSSSINTHSAYKKPLELTKNDHNWNTKLWTAAACTNHNEANHVNNNLNLKVFIECVESLWREAPQLNLKKEMLIEWRQRRTSL